MDGNPSTVEHGILRWPGFEEEAGRFGATSSFYGKRAALPGAVRAAGEAEETEDEGA